MHHYVDVDGHTLRIICVVNKTDQGNNGWQMSLKLACEKLSVRVVPLEDVYEIEELIFLSLEFDRIIVPQRFRTDARLFNIHFSLLPAYKGMYTSAWPILNGEEKSGVTLHRIDAGIDTGEIIAQKEFSIKGMTSRELYLSYIKYGTELVIENLDDIISGREISRPQPAKGSSYYSRKSIDYKNLTIDLNQTAENIERQIRAFNFREYQIPMVYGRGIIGTKITDIRSYKKPGMVVTESDTEMVLATIDYDIVLIYDKA